MFRPRNQRIPLALKSVVLGALLCTTTVNAEYVEPDHIEPFNVVYEVGNHLINAGTAELSLQRDGDLWSYGLSTTPRGIIKLAGKGYIRESSTIRFTRSEDGALEFQPQTYLYNQDNERRRAVDASFDWNTNTVTYIYRGKETTEEFDQPVIDRLTATLLIMDSLRKEKFDSKMLKVFDTKRIKDVLFDNLGNETLETPLGDIETIRVINRNADGGSRQTTTWFAPSLDYVPVRIEHRKRGELVARLNLLLNPGCCQNNVGLIDQALLASRSSLSSH